MYAKGREGERKEREEEGKERERERKERGGGRGVKRRGTNKLVKVY